MSYGMLYIYNIMYTNRNEIYFYLKRLNFEIDIITRLNYILVLVLLYSYNLVCVLKILTIIFIIYMNFINIYLKLSRQLCP